MAKQKQETSPERNQGEGDKKSAERYNESAQAFVKSGKVKRAAEEAAGQDGVEAETTERMGRERAKEEDPALRRDYRKSGSR
jgi:hypothetical protein